MKKTLILPILLCVTLAFAQEQPAELHKQQHEITALKQQVSSLQTAVKQLQTEVSSFSVKTESQAKQIDSLQAETKTNARNIQMFAEDLGTKILETETTAKDGISKLDKDVSKNRLYWIIGTMVIFLLGGVVYWLLGRRIQISKTDVETQIKNTKKTLEEEGVKLDSKLVEVLETQLKLKKEEKQTVMTTEEIDHSLTLKVADEIIRIQKNLHQMDANTKGLKQLSASIKRIQDNFVSNGYELVEMLGKEYNEGMKVVPNFIPNEELEKGKQIITRIIKPQVNFKGEMIQSAQIEVSVGE